ncbi:type II toxin-antitoxin system RelE/ParE family toxin [Asticcacaulis sp.]|uniref:type II toxin-antitoxin system RelE/ParE family toxin n=1 Tax=Asticcacaulis sp. TaxID=1872648 RepID=UPI003F7B485A
MRDLRWTRRALWDLHRLHSFLAANNPDAARRAVASIRQGVRILASHPEAGRHPDDLPEDVREWPVPFGQSGYVVAYQTTDEAVIIHSVRHMFEAGY